MVITISVVTCPNKFCLTTLSKKLRNVTI